MDTNALVKQRQQQLDKIYNPQIDLVKQQMQAIPGQFEGQRSALDQAKTNAFRDITQTANRRGMFFSGFQPQEQARYLGTEYLPGLQNLDAQQNQARLGLMEQLTGIRGQRAQTMTDFQEQLRQERAQRQEQMRQEQVQREEQMRQERVAQRSGGGGGSRGGSSGGSSGSTADRYEGFSVERKADGAGLSFRGPGDRPISMVEYAQNTGTGLDSLLRQGSDYDKEALQQMNRLRGKGWPESNILAYLRNNYPLIF